jgi:hypothetical protein
MPTIFPSDFSRDFVFIVFIYLFIYFWVWAPFLVIFKSFKENIYPEIFLIYPTHFILF